MTTAPANVECIAVEGIMLRECVSNGSIICFNGAGVGFVYYDAPKDCFLASLDGEAVGNYSGQTATEAVLNCFDATIRRHATALTRSLAMRKAADNGIIFED